MNVNGCGRAGVGVELWLDTLTIDIDGCTVPQLTRQGLTVAGTSSSS